MARVTIGVPVYNGAPLIRESLECLRTQTYQDFEVLIGDNASTDETGDICAEFAARDSRFIHIRRPENLGSLPNFVDLRRRATSELFLWRAYDDLSDAEFLAALVAALDARPGARLAVCDVVSRADDRGRDKVFPYRAPWGGPRIAGIAHQLFSSHASWIYGLWHRETLAAAQDRVHESYPHAWGWDHLCFLPLILDRAIAGTGEVRFVQRIVRGGTTRAERKAKLPGVAAMRALRADFDRCARAEVARRDWSITERAILGLILPNYIDRRGYSRFKLLRRRLREGSI